MAYLFTHPSNLFTWRHSWLAIAGGQLVGIAVEVPSSKFAALELKSAGPWFKFHGLLAGLRAGLRSLAVDSFKRRLRPDSLYVIFLAVAPEFRGQGVGARLLDALRQQAAQEGLKFVELDCEVTNHRGLSFYLRYGMTKLGEQKPAWWCRRWLASAGIQGAYRLLVSAFPSS